MNPDTLLEDIHVEVVRVFPDAHFIILENLPFYRKVRFLLKKKLFIEIRINTRNERMSYALVDNGKRIAGFDNLGSWHIHPFENPKLHRRTKAPSPRKVFAYFKEGIAKENRD